MEYSKIPVDAFEHIQMGAGMLVDEFNPATNEYGNILGATTGGLQVSAKPTFSDYAEDIDNAPKNTMEYKKVDDIEVTVSGTFVTITPELAKMLVATGTIDPNDARHITVRKTLTTEDFKDVWVVSDYSDVNTGENAGYCAVHIMNALNTDGFSMQTTNNGKGNFGFNMMGHYSSANQDQVPLEIYIKDGSEAVVPSIHLDKNVINLEDGGTKTLTVTKVPSDAVVSWSTGDSSVATVSNGVVTAEGEGNTIIAASITVDGVEYNDTCTVIVNAG